MPQLYPLKVEQKGHNFVANGVSDIPLKLPVDEKNKLFSKNYYAKLKNKTMSIPVDYKEDIMRRSPEKPKLPFVSVRKRIVQYSSSKYSKIKMQYKFVGLHQRLTAITTSFVRLLENHRLRR